MPEMKSLTYSIRIDAPPSAVAELLEDVNRVPEWNPLVEKIELEEEPADANFGTSCDWKARMAGLPFGGSSTLITRKKGRKYAWVNRDKYVGLRLDGEFTLEPYTDGTKLIAIVSYLQPTRFPDSVYERLAKLVLGRRIKSALKNIKAIVENSS